MTDTELPPYFTDGPVTEPHAFVHGPYRMHCCWICGKGGSAKIHKPEGATR